MESARVLERARASESARVLEPAQASESARVLEPGQALESARVLERALEPVQVPLLEAASARWGWDWVRRRCRNSESRPPHCR